MDTIKDILPGVIENLVQKKPQTNKDIQKCWSHVAGDTSKHTRVNDYQQGRLRIHVDSPARLYQIGIKKQIFIEELKKEFPELVDIIFKVEKIQ